MEGKTCADAINQHHEGHHHVRQDHCNLQTQHVLSLERQHFKTLFHRKQDLKEQG